MGCKVDPRLREFGTFVQRARRWDSLNLGPTLSTISVDGLPKAKSAVNFTLFTPALACHFDPDGTKFLTCPVQPVRDYMNLLRTGQDLRPGHLSQCVDLSDP